MIIAGVGLAFYCLLIKNGSAGWGANNGSVALIVLLCCEILFKVFKLCITYAWVGLINWDAEGSLTMNSFVFEPFLEHCVV